jgi:serine/threonine protein kinase
VRLLGYGGTGQTLLYRDRRTDELSAVKLIRRPVPEIIQQRLLREFTVRVPLCDPRVRCRRSAAAAERICVLWSRLVWTVSL